MRAHAVLSIRTAAQRTADDLDYSPAQNRDAKAFLALDPESTIMSTCRSIANWRRIVMALEWRERFVLGVIVVCGVVGPASSGNAGEPAKIVRHVVVYREDGRFAGWPANHGIWSWGDEILVGFSRGYDKDRGPFHHIDKEKPEEFLLARSRDGGARLVGRTAPSRRGSGRHAGHAPRRSCRRAHRRNSRPSSHDPIDFTHPDFAMTVRMENTNAGTSRFYFSYDRGHTWRGPYACRCSARRASWAAPTTS